MITPSETKLIETLSTFSASTTHIIVPNTATLNWLQDITTFTAPIFTTHQWRQRYDTTAHHDPLRLLSLIQTCPSPTLLSHQFATQTAKQELLSFWHYCTTTNTRPGDILAQTPMASRLTMDILTWLEAFEHHLDLTHQLPKAALPLPPNLTTILTVNTELPIEISTTITHIPITSAPLPTQSQPLQPFPNITHELTAIYQDICQKLHQYSLDDIQLITPTPDRYRQPIKRLFDGIPISDPPKSLGLTPPAQFLFRLLALCLPTSTTHDLMSFLQGPLSHSNQQLTHYQPIIESLDTIPLSDLPAALQAHRRQHRFISGDDLPPIPEFSLHLQDAIYTMQISAENMAKQLQNWMDDFQITAQLASHPQPYTHYLQLITILTQWKTAYTDMPWDVKTGIDSLKSVIIATQLSSDQTGLHILRPEDAVGCHKPVRYIIGLTQSHWPQPAATQSYLTAAIQTPDTTPDPTEIAKKQLDFFEATTDHLWLSYPTTIAQTPQYPTPLCPTVTKEKNTPPHPRNSNQPSPPQPITPSIPSPPETVSATQLETYQTCPQKYQYKYVDKLPDTQSIDHRHQALKGTLIHRILDGFFKSIAHPPSTSDTPILLDIANTQLTKSPLPTYLKKSLQHTLPPLLTACLKSFESAPYKITPVATETPFSIALTPNTTLTGAIDLIAACDEHLYIIDFKTGKTIPTMADINRNTSLQLPIYLLAAHHIHPNKTIAGAGYIHLKPEPEHIIRFGSDHAKHHLFERSRKRFIRFDGPESISKITTTLTAIVAKISTGRFTIPDDFSPSTCRTCPYKTVCRFEKRFS